MTAGTHPQRSAGRGKAQNAVLRSPFTPRDLNEAGDILRHEGWDVRLEQGSHHEYRLHAERGGVIASIALSTRFTLTRKMQADPETQGSGVRVTILTPYGYACLGSPCISVTLAAQWVSNSLRVDEACAEAQRKYAEQGLRRNNLWTPRLKFVRKAFVLRGSTPRSPESSEMHTRRRYRERYGHTLSEASLNELLQAACAAPILEQQPEGRTIRRVSFEGNDLIVVVSPDESYLVTTLRIFEYVNLRIARHLLTPNRAHAPMTSTNVANTAQRSSFLHSSFLGGSVPAGARA